MSIFLQNYVQLLQGARNKPVPPMIQGGFTVMDDGGFTVQLSYLQIMIMVTTLVLMVCFTQFINTTSLGRQQRACEQDKTRSDEHTSELQSLMRISYAVYC